MFTFIKTIESELKSFEDHLKNFEALEATHLKAVATYAKTIVDAQVAQTEAGAKAALANGIAAKIKAILGVQ